MISDARESEREVRFRVIFGDFFGNFDRIRRYKRSRNVMNIESAKSVIFVESVRVSALRNDIGGELLEGVVEGSGEHVVENELRGESGHV
jgi:hypothetical protein